MAAVAAALHGIGLRRGNHQEVGEEELAARLQQSTLYSGRGWVKTKMYEVFETEDTWPAIFMSAFLLLCIFASTVCFVVETMPVYENLPIWRTLEAVFVVIFTGEYVLRWYCAKDTTYDFVMRPMNMIDLLAIMPFYLDVVSRIVNPGNSVGLDLRVLRALRLVRIFKVGRYSRQVQLIAGSVSRSVTSLALLAFMLVIALVVYGTLIYLVERGDWHEDKACYVRHDGHCSPFQSIPASFWWGITTMTTVGYGDTFPITDGGKLVAGFAMITGILCVALPTTVLGVQFSDAYCDLERDYKIQEVVDSMPGVGERGAALDERLGSIRGLVTELDQLLPKLGNALEDHAKRDLTQELIALGLLADGTMESLEALLGMVDTMRQ